MFLIQLHIALNFWKKLGVWTYLVSVLEWLPVAFILYLFQGQILYYTIALGVPFLVLGVGLIVAGIALHAWTAKLLG